jgi:hypothetical protein
VDFHKMHAYNVVSLFILSFAVWSKEAGKNMFIV